MRTAVPGGDATTIGRDGELSRLERLLDGARAGAGGVALIEGEAGIGKTHLLRLVHYRAGTRGLTVYAGACEPLERNRPFAPFAQALGALPRTGARSPALEGGGGPLAAGDRRFLVQEAIVDHVEARATAAPLLLTVDDLQWADEPSLAALAALGRRAADLPLVLVAAHRPTPPLPDRLVEVLTGAGADVVTLAPLPPDEVAGLTCAAVGAPPGDDLQALLAGAGGNPFLVLELLRALDDEGALAVDGGTAGTTFRGLPPTLRHTVLRRVRSLSPGALDLLRAGAVLGGGFELAAVAAVLERSPVSLHPEVFAALHAGVLREDGDRLRFRHDLIREAIYADVPGPVRVSLHRQAAHVLTGRAAPATVVADHLVKAGSVDEPAAVDSLRRAAGEVAAADPETALDLLDRALSPPFVDARSRVEMSVDRAQLLAAAGRLAEAEEVARATLAGGPPADLRVGVEITLAEILLMSGHAAAAAAVLDAASGSDALDLRTEARLLADRAWSRLAGYDLAGAARDAAEAERLAGRAEDAASLTSALAVSCRLAAFAVDFDRAVDTGRRAVAAGAAGAAGDPVGLQRTPHFYLGLALMNADRVDEAVDVLGEGRRLAEAAGLPSAVATYHAGLITCGFHSGRWDDGTAEAGAARLLHADTGTRRGLMQAESMLGLMWFHRGEHEAARQALARAEADLARPGHDAGGVVWLLWLRAAFAEADGDAAEAGRLLGTAFDLAVTTGVDLVKLWFGPEAARLAAHAGDRDRAASIASEVEDVAARAGTAGAVGAAHLCAGLASDDPARLAAAVDAYRGSSRRPDLARAHEEHGRVLAAAGDHDGAVAAFDAAVAVLDELGAHHDRRRVEGRLRELGVRRGARGTRRRPATGPGSLTPAEEDVLRLAGEGLANAEIAERLYVSRRTVETHVGRLYAKLGVRGRVALADASRTYPYAHG